MPLSRHLITQFFLFESDEHYASAERVLNRLQSGSRKSGWERGYLTALSGIIVTRRSREDDLAFLNRINMKDKKELRATLKDFKEQSKNEIHADYDRGFFSAWADYIRFHLKRTDVTHQPF